MSIQNQELLEAVTTITKTLSKTIRFGERSYRMPAIVENQVATSPRHEPWLDPAIQACLALKQGTFIDVGANLGQTMIKLLRIDPDRAYLGFEPQISCCFFLDLFFSVNQLVGHRIVPFGLSNKSGFEELQMRFDSGDSTASIVRGFRPDNFYTRSQIVPVTTGDTVWQDLGIGDVSIIKIDVEGGELEVLQGFHQTLERSLPFIVFEVLDHYLRVTGDRLDPATISFRKDRIWQCESLLRNLGYRLFHIKSESQLREVEKILPPSEPTIASCDYLALPANQLDAFNETFDGEFIQA